MYTAHSSSPLLPPQPLVSVWLSLSLLICSFPLPTPCPPSRSPLSRLLSFPLLLFSLPYFSFPPFPPYLFLFLFFFFPFLPFLVTIYKLTLFILIPYTSFAFVALLTATYSPCYSIYTYSLSVFPSILPWHLVLIYSYLPYCAPHSHLSLPSSSPLNLSKRT